MSLITLAIHTHERAHAVARLLETEGVRVTLQNVSHGCPEIPVGVRIRIQEDDLALALRIVENPEIFSNDSRPTESVAPSSHHILVPVDFSDHSINAVNVALKIAAGQKSDIAFLHSYFDPRLSTDASISDRLTFEFVETEESLAASSEAKIKMKDFGENLKEQMKRADLDMIRFTTDVVEGVPEDVIAKYAKEHLPSLVVMGTRTAESKERDMIGSVTAQVLDECRFPVLSIPANFDSDNFTNPSNILFFGNLDQEDILAMDTLYRFFPSASSSVTIVHIPGRNRLADSDAGRSAHALGEYCSKTFSHFKFRSVPLTLKYVAEELKALQAEQKFDLLVVPNRRKSAFSRFFNPGLPYKILFQTDIPMLVIPV